MVLELNNEELTQNDIQFGKQLASTEKHIRNKAVSTLSRWLANQKDLDKLGYLKIWKGLFYCYWLCDKPEYQHELAEILASMIDNARDKNVFLLTFWETMAREWPGIDRWRINKYYNLFRCVLGQSVQSISAESWIEIYQNGPLKPNDSKFPLSIQLSVIEKFVTEVYENFEGSESADSLLDPFYNLLTKSTNFTVVERLIDSVFKPILTKSVLDDKYEDAETVQVTLFDPTVVSNRLLDIFNSDLVLKHKKKIAELLNQHASEFITIPQELKDLVKPKKRTLIASEKVKKRKKELNLDTKWEEALKATNKPSTEKPIHKPKEKSEPPNPVRAEPYFKPPTRAYLKNRDKKFDFEKNLNKTLVANLAGPLSEQPGFYCKSCDRLYKSSDAYLEHCNSVKHQRIIGNSLRVERSTLEDVKSRFQMIKERPPEVNEETYDMEENLKQQEMEAEMKRKERTAKKKEKKKSILEQTHIAPLEVDPDVESEMKAMGFDFTTFK